MERFGFTAQFASLASCSAFSCFRRRRARVLSNSKKNLFNEHPKQHNLDSFGTLLRLCQTAEKGVYPRMKKR